MILIGLGLFCVGFAVGILVGGLLKEIEQNQKTIEDRSYHSQSRYNPMQDTSDAMYNEHGVHKYNPMLDR